MDIAVFTADSLALFSVPPLAGRLFGAADQTCRVAVVNEEAAEGLFGSETIGRSIRDPAGLAVEIIGVLARRKGEPKRSRPTIYYYRPDQTRLSLHSAASEHFRVPAAAKLERAELDANIVSASYFSAMGFSVAAGQIFSEDPGRHECRVGVINQEAADVYFKGKAVGAALIDESGRRTEIIGVVQSAQLGSFQRRVEPAIYFPMAQDYLPRMALTLILGAREVNGAMLVELRKKIESVPGRGPGPLTVKTLETHLGQTALAPLRIATMMLGASAATALLLSVLGLFGALDEAARQRRREFVVRIALGAQRRHVIWQVLSEGGRLAFGGTLAGMLGSLLLLRMLARILPYNGSPALWVWLAAPLVLGAGVALASVVPARSALIVNPLTIMRDDN